MIPEAFTNAIRHLAFSADDQIEMLRQLGCPGVVDELALQLDDYLPLAKELLAKGQLTEVKFRLVLDINVILDQISGNDNAPLWTEDALRNSPVWEAIRHLARRYFE